MSYDFKQVIVMRKKYPDGNGGERKLRTGKYIAQAAHASLGVILDHFIKNGKLTTKGCEPWFSGGFAKICLGVDTESEVRAIYGAALAAGIPAKLIVDSGHTEFDGKATVTCCAIGPAQCTEIDKICGHLSLM